MSNEVTFIHLSDPHLIAPSKQASLYGVNTNEKLSLFKEVFSSLPFKPAFFIMSGDLIHDGDEADYQYVKEFIRNCEKQFQAPFLLTLGNHDRRKAFRSVFLNESKSEAPYYYSKTVGGVRVIVLDTKIPNEVNGEVSIDQLNWLADILKVDTEKGTIIAMHHPPIDDHLRNKAAFGNMIEGTDVIGILAGHTHNSCLFQFHSIPCTTVFSTAYGMEELKNTESSQNEYGTVKDRVGSSVEQTTSETNTIIASDNKETFDIKMTQTTGFHKVEVKQRQMIVYPQIVTTENSTIF